MRIVEHTSRRLKFQDFRTLFSSYFLLILGLGFGGWCSLFFFYVIKTYSNNILNCSRNQINQISCEVKRSNSFHIYDETKVIPSGELQIAQVEESRDSDDNSVSYKINLITKHDKLDLIKYNSYNKDRIESIANEINNFIENVNQKSLEIKIVGHFGFLGFFALSIGTIIGTLVFTGGLSTIIWPPYILVDKDSGEFVMRKNRLFGWVSITYNLSEIKGIKIKESVDSEGDTHILSLLLLLNSGEEIDINKNGFWITEEKAETMKKFLGSQDLTNG